MPVVLTSAAVAGRKNERRGILEPRLMNPFKRRWRRNNDEPIAEEAPQHSRAKSRETRGVAEQDAEPNESDSNDGPGKQRELMDGTQRDFNPTSNPPSNPASNPVSNPTSSDALAESPVSESRWHETRPAEGENADISITADEPYLLTATPYPTLVRRFALVPITCLFTISILVLLLHVIWSSPTWSSSFTSYLGFFIYAAVAWVVTFSFRIPLYLISSATCRFAPALAPFFSALLQVFCEEVLRLAVIVLANLRLREALQPSDPAFPSLWMLGMGWATAEVAVSVWQGYEQLALYKDVLLPVNDAPESSSRSFPDDPWVMDESSIRDESGDLRTRHLFEDPDGYIHKEIEQLIRMEARLELEEVYGIPVPNIPVFISCLQRIDSIILSLALFLYMSSSYLENVARQGNTQKPSSDLNTARAIQDTIPAFLVIVVLHTFLSFICSATILPRIGVHSASYTALLLSLGALFAGLGRWDAL